MSKPHHALLEHQAALARCRRCFPGKMPRGGDRVPDPGEIRNCSSWLDAELAINRPRLVIPVGKLAIQQFVPAGRLDAVVGKLHRTSGNGVTFDLAPLPHPSGASTWQYLEPGKTLLRQALTLIASHRAWLRAGRGMDRATGPDATVLWRGPSLVAE